jgi:hypothetical protein
MFKIHPGASLVPKNEKNGKLKTKFQVRCYRISTQETSRINMTVECEMETKNTAGLLQF